MPNVVGVSDHVWISGASTASLCSTAVVLDRIVITSTVAAGAYQILDNTTSQAVFPAGTSAGIYDMGIVLATPVIKTAANHQVLATFRRLV